MIGKPPLVLVDDALALNFLNTQIALPAMRLDYLDSGDSLLAWMREVQLLDPDCAAFIRSHSTEAALEKVAAEVRELREWFRQFIARGALEPPTRLNEILKTDDTFTSLVPGDAGAGSPIRLLVRRRNTSARCLLLCIAEMLARFLCEEPLAAIRTCTGAGCSLMFRDRHSGSARRHCGMPQCVEAHA